jgi:hypothetical protein
MGIHKLMSLLNEKAPTSVRKLDLSAFAGRIVACVKLLFRMPVWLCISF